MIKRTIYFGNPARLYKKDEQLVVQLNDKEETKNIPIEDIGVLLLDDPQISITQALLAALVENNVALISCDSTHHPIGLMMPLSSNSLQSAKFKAQIEATLPLKKQLWQQTVKAKIRNQALHLKLLGKNEEPLEYMARQVNSGDTENFEGRAAAVYWKELFGDDFRRERNGLPPNNLLNYGYAILRAIVARGLVSSGLLPTLGIFHRNQYNAYCLADDIMEPYRPFVDKLVNEIFTEPEINYYELTPELKRKLLGLATVDIFFKDETGPLMVGLQRTTASLCRCFEQMQRSIEYPTLYAV